MPINSNTTDKSDSASQRSREMRKARQINTEMKPDELALLDTFAKKYGSRKQAILAGLAALKSDEERTIDELLDVIRSKYSAISQAHER